MTAMADARLEVTDPQGRRVVILDKPAFTIGRRGTNDLQLTGTDVSRHHAEIVRNNGQYLVRDCGSRCGTYVNGLQITERRLSHGDRIQLGRTADAQMVFLSDDRPVDADVGSRSGPSAVAGAARSWRRPG